MHHTWIYISLTRPSADPPEADSQLANLPRPPGTSPPAPRRRWRPHATPPEPRGFPPPNSGARSRACSPPPLTKTPGANWPTSPVRRRPGPPAPPSSWVSDPRPGGLAPPPLGGRSPRRGLKGFSRRAASHEKRPANWQNPRAASSPPAAVPGDPRRPPGPLAPGHPPSHPRTIGPQAPGGHTPLRYGYGYGYGYATATGGLSDLPWALIVRECVPASESGWGGAVFSYFAIFAARPTGHGPSRRDAAKTLGQLARPGGGARPAWPSREAPPSQAPGQLAASSSGPRGPKSLDQLAGRDRHRRLALSSAPHPKTAGQLARSLARGSDPRGQGPGSETPLQAPGAAGPQQGYLTAYTTRLVTSVVCRGFIPARGDIAIRQPAPEGFSPGAVASLLRFRARRPIRIQLRRAGLHRRVPARILT
ncbi:hypothetical protein HFD88_009473 [Aspergillus terreus]|nr:hypothetical protein HFD88_009473 [Aspergillus terreus]